MKEVSRWKLYSAAILILFSFFQLMQWPLLPKFLDIYYHLFAMKGFALSGGFPAFDFWEYAPGGRPHLYPPLLHFFMLSLYRIGLSVITIGRLTDLLIYPLLLWVFWHVSRRLFSERFAFFALIFISSSYSAYLACVTLAPFSLGFLFGLLALLDFQEKKTIQAALWMSLSFFSHFLAAWSFFFALVLYGVVSGQWKAALKTALGGLLLALPLVGHNFAQRHYFHFLNVKENLFIETDAFIYFLAFAGLWVALRGKKIFLFPAALLVAESFFLSSHRFRFFSGHGLFALSWLAALSVETFLVFLQKKNKSRWVLVLSLGLVAGMYFFAPIVLWDLKNQETKVVYGDRTLTRYLLPDSGKNFRAKGFSIYFEKEYAELASVVKEHSEANDILWSDFAHGGALVALLSDRVTSTAMLPEVSAYKNTDAIKDSKICIWYKNPDRPQGKPLGMEEAVKKYSLRAIRETELAFVYENSGSFLKRAQPKALVPEYALYATALSYILAFLFLTRASLYNIIKKFIKRPEKL